MYIHDLFFVLLRGEKKIFFFAQITFLLHLESLEPYLKKQLQVRWGYN